MKMTFRNSYLSALLLLVLIALHACTQESAASSKETENHSQKKEDTSDVVDVNKVLKIADDAKNNVKDEIAKLKFVKPVPVVKVPVDPEPWPYPEPDPVPYPFPEPPIFPEPKQIYEPKQEEILDIAEVQPEFPGGTEALMKFIEANIIYPELERELNIEGKVYVGFVVMKTGEITNIKIMRGVKDAPGLDKEAIRIVKLMPRWTPGMNNGQKVNVRTIVPIRFSLK